MSSGAGWTSIDAPRGLPPRLRWIGWLVVLGVVAGLVAFALVQGDKIVRDIAASVVRTGVIAALQLPEEQEMDVDLGGGLVVLQAATGSIDAVDVRIPGVVFGPATGTLHLTLEGVALDPDKPVDRLTARMEIDEAGMLAFSGNLSAGTVTAVTLDGGVVSPTTDLGGVPVTTGLVPTLAGGIVSFVPSTVTTDAAPVPVEEALAGPSGPSLGPVVTTQPLCVAQLLPAALPPVSVGAEGGVFTAAASAEGVSLGGGGLAAKGACA
jgi:hypothetical protein